MQCRVIEVRVEALVQWRRDEHGGADCDGLGARARPRQPPREAGGWGEKEGQDTHSLDGHQRTDHRRDADAVRGFKARELRPGDEAHQRVVHDLHDPDHPEHPHRGDHLGDGGNLGQPRIHNSTSATTA